jgi:two-component system response regulator GlrR
MSDVPEVAAHLLREAATQFGALVEGFTPLALERLLAYPWPGNIRELRNKIQQAVAGSLGPFLGPDELDLPSNLAAVEPRIEALDSQDLLGMPLRESRRKILDRFEREYLRRLLADTGGNVSRAATQAGLPRKALARLIARHDMASHAHGRRGRPRLRVVTG